LGQILTGYVAGMTVLPTTSAEYNVLRILLMYHSATSRSLLFIITHSCITFIGAAPQVETCFTVTYSPVFV